MNPIEEWVDAGELRRMADALLGKPEEVSVEDSLFGSDFVGFEAELAGPMREGEEVAARPSREAAENARRALAAAREIAQRGGLLEVASQAGGGDSAVGRIAAELTQVAPLQPTRGAKSLPLIGRLQAFGEWLGEAVAARGFFVIDRQGAVLIDDVQSSKIHRIACTLAQASYPSVRQIGGAAPGNLHAQISADAVLEVIPVNTLLGPLILGTIVPRSLNSTQAEAVAAGLHKALEGEEASRAP